MNSARNALIPCLIFVAAFVTFLPALQADFVNWDDYDTVVKNPGVHGLGLAQLRWMWTGAVLGHWIPLTWMSFGFNYVLGGLRPAGYHLFNLLLHAASATCFYFIGRRLLKAAHPAWGAAVVSAGAGVAAILFAVHPLRVESVVWVTERKDVLCGIFFMLAALWYLRAAEDKTLKRGWACASLAAFTAAILSKAAAVPLPALLLLLDVYPLGRVRRYGWGHCLLEKLPWVALGGMGGAVALHTVLTGTGVTTYAAYGVPSRLAMTAYTFMFYPTRWLWPVELSPLYELPAHLDPSSRRFVVPMVAFAIITSALVALRRRWPAGLTAWTASITMLLPISGIVHSGQQLAHDRYSYLSGLGFALLAGGGFAWLLDSQARGRVSPVIARSVVAGTAVVTVMLALATWDHAKVWQDSESLWRWAISVDSNCAVCWNDLGTALTTQKRYAEAETASRRAMELRPDRATYPNNVAVALFSQGRTAEAEEMLRLALRLDPTLPGALANMAYLLAQTGRAGESLDYFRRAYAGDPHFADLVKNYVEALRGEAATLVSARRPGSALALLHEALRLNPADAETRRQIDALGGDPLQSRISPEGAPRGR